MGVPISVEQITHTDPPADGYRIREADYYLRDPGFEPTSSPRCTSPRRPCGSTRPTASRASEARRRGRGPVAGPGVQRRRAARRPQPRRRCSTRSPNRLPALQRPRPRIDPYRLDFQRGRWYLTGFDRDKGEERNFRVDRIDGAVTLGEARSFDRPETAVRGGPAQPWQFGEGDPVTAHLLVDRDQAGWVRGHLGDDTVAEERADGSIVFRVDVNNWPAFRSFVLTFLEHAEILSPPELRGPRAVAHGWRERARWSSSSGVDADRAALADDRMQRMLSIIPWVAAQDGVTVDEVCERFHIDRKALVADFDILSFVGVYPYTPDTQIDAVIEGDTVYVHLPQWFDRPLRLTPEQGMSLVASAQSLLSIPGADPEGPLARGIDKIAGVAGGRRRPRSTSRSGRPPPRSWRCSRTPPSTTARSRSTTTPTGGTRSRPGSSSPTASTPTRATGTWRRCATWPVATACSASTASTGPSLDTTFAPPAETPTMGVFRPSPDDPRVTLRLQPSARWVAEQYPTEELVAHDDGTVDVTIAVTARAWLERLLVRLGPDADGRGRSARARRGRRRRAAARILARYRDGSMTPAPRLPLRRRPGPARVATRTPAPGRTARRGRRGRAVAAASGHRHRHRREGAATR